MSFGFSPSDILTLISLTNKAVNGWQKAPADYAGITQTLDAFNLILGRISSHFTERKDANGRCDLVPDQWLARVRIDQMALDRVLEGCRDAVKELDRLAKRFKGVSSSHWKRIRLSFTDIEAPLTRLTRHVGFLNTFLQTVELDSIDLLHSSVHQSLDNLPLNVSSAVTVALGRIIDTRTADSRSARESILSSHGDDDKLAWKELRREIRRMGISDAVVRNHKSELKDFVKSIVDDRPPRSSTEQEVCERLLALEEPQPPKNARKSPLTSRQSLESAAVKADQLVEGDADDELECDVGHVPEEIVLQLVQPAEETTRRKLEITGQEKLPVCLAFVDSDEDESYLNVPYRGTLDGPLLEAVSPEKNPRAEQVLQPLQNLPSSISEITKVGITGLDNTTYTSNAHLTSCADDAIANALEVVGTPTPYSFGSSPIRHLPTSRRRSKYRSNNASYGDDKIWDYSPSTGYETTPVETDLNLAQSGNYDPRIPDCDITFPDADLRRRLSKDLDTVVMRKGKYGHEGLSHNGKAPALVANKRNARSSIKAEDTNHDHGQQSPQTNGVLFREKHDSEWEVSQSNQNSPVAPNKAPGHPLWDFVKYDRKLLGRVELDTLAMQNGEYGFVLSDDNSEVSHVSNKSSSSVRVQADPEQRYYTHMLTDNEYSSSSEGEAHSLRAQPDPEQQFYMDMLTDSEWSFSREEQAPSFDDQLDPGQHSFYQGNSDAQNPILPAEPPPPNSQAQSFRKQPPFRPQGLIGYRPLSIESDGPLFVRLHLPVGWRAEGWENADCIQFKDLLAPAGSRCFFPMPPRWDRNCRPDAADVEVLGRCKQSRKVFSENSCRMTAEAMGPDCSHLAQDLMSSPSDLSIIVFEVNSRFALGWRQEFLDDLRTWALLEAPSEDDVLSEQA